jgi:dolichol-phosphate mannosyltransferase
MKATVIIPTYNEAQNLPRLLEQVFSLGIDGINIIIVDDNSPDGTGKLAEDLAKKYPGRMEIIHRKGKMGLASAYIAGFRLALERGAEAVFEMDADFSHSPEYLPRFLEKLENCDVVVGSRYIRGAALDSHWGLWRKFISRAGNSYVRLVTGLKVRDTSAGFKCFRRRVLEGLALDSIRSEGYAFQIEVAYMCQKKGYKVEEVPIFFSQRASGKSKMSSKILLESLWRPWRLRLSQ